MNATELPKKHLVLLGIVSVTGPIWSPKLAEIMNKGKPDRGKPGAGVPYTPLLISTELREMCESCALKVTPEGVDLSAVGQFFMEVHSNRREVRRGIRFAINAT